MNHKMITLCDETIRLLKAFPISARGFDQSCVKECKNENQTKASRIVNVAILLMQNGHHWIICIGGIVNTATRF